ncbi:unnamed protein product [Ilex paraguariensis]|uniref:GTD-binding domain-containing protein n=1 Tax=Ilex paraguariensis TaxID=185542 RepID=A0ABC8RAX3_9AQUA
MACQAMHYWTFSGLVGAFVDLAIAYLLLCASTITFFASKFLGIFGLCLPCPCNGLFGTPNRNYCLHRMLLDLPAENVSNVQFSIKTKFPFDSIWVKEQNCHLNMMLVKERDGNVDGFVEVEGEASCSFISDAKKSQIVAKRDLVPRTEIGVESGMIESPGVKEERFDLKGKGVENQMPKGGIRRRRKVGAACGILSSVSSYDPSSEDKQDIPLNPSINNEGNEIIEGSSMPATAGIDANHQYDGEAPVFMRLGENVSNDYESTKPFFENNFTEKKESSVEVDEKNAIRILEQALEEEHAARTALYLELEKERSAAASAADEAMAMILRLQEEKASIEMEARQYHRIIEEKSAYDDEEMNILKEILLRREMEKHFLEKEVEAYRQTVYLGNEQSEDDVRDPDSQNQQWPTSSLDLSEDPILMLHQLCESIDKKEILKNIISDNEAKVKPQNCALALDNGFLTQGWGGDADFSNQVDTGKQFPYVSLSHNNGILQFQEKEMLSVDKDTQPSERQRLETPSLAYNSSVSQIHELPEKTIPLASEEQGQKDNENLYPGTSAKGMETHGPSEICIPYNNEHAEQCETDAHVGSIDPWNLMYNKELHVHDIHVIEHGTNFCTEVGGNKIEQLKNETSNDQRKSDVPSKASASQRMENHASTSRLGIGPDINRITSDMTSGLPPMGSYGGSLLSDMRRNSMSAFDNERLKIDTEVGRLREKLRIVQEGREKLNLSLEQREREKLQLQLLEDIAYQLREIQQLTEPGKAVRQVSLPPPSSKVQL